MRHLKKWFILIFLVVFLTGCIEKPLQKEKIQELTFVVSEENEIPEELKSQIEKAKEKAFRMSYEDAGMLYIAEGYGMQPKTGYYVEVIYIYETEDAVVFHTHLMGPQKGEETEDEESYPYVVAVVENIGKKVLFE